MNKKFFKKHIPEGQEILWLVHQHRIRIIWKLFLYLIWFVFIPSFLYYFSWTLKELIPFYILEIYLILTYIKIIYEIFNWYNDVWIITDEWITDLDRSLLKTNIKTIAYENVEWIEIDQNSIWDKILNKWDLKILLIWEWEIVLKDAIIPYKALNQIEKISKEKADSGEEEVDKLDVFMDTLSWFLWNYLWEKWIDKEKLKKKEEIIFKAMEEWWTVDLREGKS